ncbi:hypothetical protein BGW80DRAFT_1396299 [Lactifluus volemus]|nr:hypothetical protein BGW80DRAFT_1396299 [Lactifluus volemus]
MLAFPPRATCFVFVVSNLDCGVLCLTPHLGSQFVSGRLPYRDNKRKREEAYGSLPLFSASVHLASLEVYLRSTAIESKTR